MKSITIILEGKPYKIYEFTIGQLEDLHIGVVRPVPQDFVDSTKHYWDQSIDILAAALSVDHKDVTRDTIKNMRLGNIKAVKEVVEQIMRFAGLRDGSEPVKDDDSGERKAAAA